MSGTEQLQMDGPWWSPFAGVLELGLFLALCWVVVHPHLTSTYLRTVWTRGRDYRAQVRNARHTRPHRLLRSAR